MKSVRTAATLLAGLALVTTPTLTACSQIISGSDSSSSADSDSSSASDKSDTKDSKKDAKADKSDKDGDKASASASATKNDLPKATPAGYQEVTAPTVGITFAVPEDWQNTPLDATSDIYYKAPDDGFTPYLGNANVSKTVVPATSTPTEAQMSPALTSIPGGTSTGYSTEQTANGEAAVLNYTASIGGQTVNGALIAAPTKDKGKYAIVSVNAGSSGQTIDELKTTVIETIH
ncbi:hypothetical protein [Actinomyces sp. oral taxon 170]|jgi:hypothetical protein avisC_07244|uniref:hypothetical protein n=1 Tax=Actinomyces sp. oral taxon 170 TaxID=712117 RepID=UPI000205DEBE|nr:hypothetical protein [Actinomyces sp. oral taxon 170]EGF55783.1 conserved domain protein [Actinomyces sp. oral taxon 170 str. F0386]